MDHPAVVMQRIGTAENENARRDSRPNSTNVAFEFSLRARATFREKNASTRRQIFNKKGRP
jgi:hypothetical protein